eukprot:scaffold3740_cov146-Amphora_coffeaeformis.AAC.6
MTEKALPASWPGPVLGWMGRHKGFRWVARHIVPYFDVFRDDDKLERYANFLLTGNLKNQTKTFQRLQDAYSSTTKFVALPMDLRSLSEKCKPVQGICGQHEELADLAASNVGKIIPFIHIDPKLREDENCSDVATFIEKLHQHGLRGTKFKGIKLSPPLGYHPNDEALTPIWKYANEQGLPVVSHCSKSGVWNFKTPFWRVLKHRKEKETLMNNTAPSAYVNVLEQYPKCVSAWRILVAMLNGIGSWKGGAIKFKRGPWTTSRMMRTFLALIGSVRSSRCCPVVCFRISMMWTRPTRSSLATPGCVAMNRSISQH